MTTAQAHEAAQTEEHPDETRAAWNGIANGYDTYVTPTHLWLGNEGLRRVGLVAGMRFLDVAAGSGALSIPAARLGARVLSTDLSPVMLERLKTRAQEEGLDIKIRMMDGHALELDDNSFDVAGSQFGVMLFPDMPRGIRELARVTKSGGRVLMNVYGDPSKIEFLSFFIGAIQTVRPEFPGLPTDPPPLPLQLRDPNRLRREMTNAGLKEVHVETITESLRFDSGKDLWNWLVNSNPVAEHVLSEAKLTPADRAGVERALGQMVRERARGGGKAVLTNPIHIGIGRK